MSFTNPERLAMEALAVAVSFLVVFFAVHLIFMHFAKERAMTDHGLLALQIAVSAALFHVVCEYTGVNAYYCTHRPEHK